MGRLTSLLLLSVLIARSQNEDNILADIRSDAEAKGIPKSYMETLFLIKAFKSMIKFLNVFPDHMKNKVGLITENYLSI